MLVNYSFQGIRFEWDSKKAADHLNKHKIHFEEASEVLLDPLMREIEHQYRDGELREKVIGATVDWRLLCVVYTMRKGEIYRIISARTATKWDRRRYEEQ